MLPPEKFRSYVPDEGPDPWNGPDICPRLVTKDLKPRRKRAAAELSILIAFNDYRGAQLARTLETLARQDWDKFEVLICDVGSRLPLDELYEMFDPYLRLRTMRLERDGFSACPSRGWKALLPMARGRVIVIMQPEVMLREDAVGTLFEAHFSPPDGSLRYIISQPGVLMTGRPTWVALKVGFFDQATYEALDRCDWHTRIANVETLPRFMIHAGGMSYLTNGEVLQYREWPWWFVASAKANETIWNDMPTFDGHASIDMWMLTYRHVLGYVDIVPPGLLGYHQWHFRTSVAPAGETTVCNADVVRAIAVAKGRNLCPPPIISREEVPHWIAVGDIAPAIVIASQRKQLGSDPPGAEIAPETPPAPMRSMPDGLGIEQDMKYRQSVRIRRIRQARGEE